MPHRQLLPEQELLILLGKLTSLELKQQVQQERLEQLEKSSHLYQARSHQLQDNQAVHQIALDRQHLRIMLLEQHQQAQQDSLLGK